MIAAVLRAIAALALWMGVAHAQPEPSTSEVLRASNAAALAGDWPRVAQLVEPLLRETLATGDLAEANRLAGLAAFFEHRSAAAEGHFLAFLTIVPTGRLDPTLYPPDVVAFFNDVASRHVAELAAVRPAPRRAWWRTLVPPLGQLQNGQRTKAYALGGTLGALLVTNLTTYYFLSRWCQATDGRKGGGLSCFNGGDHTREAARLRAPNIASGIGFLAVYAYGVIDGVWGYRQRTRERPVQPYIDATANHGVLGLIGRF